MAVPLLGADTSPIEEFFMRFGGGVQQLGFTGIERLTPADFPTLAFQPVFRFRKPAERGAKVLYQVGAGIFSANAVPPYKNWKEFRPVVEKGVEILLQSRADTERDASFIAGSLRYIDAFGATLTKGLATADFVDKVLGIGLSLPQALTKRILPGEQYKPFLQLQLPVLQGMVMIIGIGEGIANKEKSIIMDTTVTTASPIAATKEAVMGAMDRAHVAIHDIFIEMTKPIHDVMKPTKVE
jgi:uncharacterized protein (TIGR04255 family)